jgi:hypothetical protein
MNTTRQCADKGSVFMQHSMSCACDAMIEYIVDRPGKWVALRMDFLAVSLLEDFLRSIAPRVLGIEAWDDDNTGPGLLAPSARTEWQISLRVGQTLYRVHLVKQIPAGGRQWALELYEVKS